MSKLLENVVVSQLMSNLNRHNLFSSFQSAFCLVIVLKLPFLKLSMTFFWQWMKASCRFWYSLTYLQRLIPLTMIYYSTAYSMCLVFKSLCYLGSDLISLKDFKLFQLKVLILTKLSVLWCTSGLCSRTHSFYSLYTTSH